MYRITVGVDAEGAAAAALDWVASWHRARTAHIVLVTAFDYLLDELDADHSVLDAAAARLRAALPDAVVETALADGSIAGVLERRSADADVLVLGSHRTRHLRSLLTGRLSLRVAKHASCPVVIVPDDWAARTGSVAAGVADDESSDAAVAFAAAEAAALGVPLRLLHAWSAPTTGTDIPALVIDPEELRAAHRERLAMVARQARERCDDVREHLHEGAAGDAFTALAADAALSVVGTHRTGMLGEILLGSTAATLVRDSRTPVCVVPVGWATPVG